ncbi:TraB/GumN family protein [Cyclobacterium sp.]|uniref:TraB/GumN family protein n=1 Tax=Cyclobacterium sp. TaxID=1966343 RepID=UPI0019B1EC80|nr:TraB/GumN family protein [Cyclobacterium sp.]MBD3626699.1 TraB/GumN family protein [Cyclobacterium sp.]
MLKRSIFILGLILIGSFSVLGQEKGVFWKISGNGLSTSSYLFGTIHLICEQDFAMSERVSDKLAQSNALVLEIDMDDPSLQMAMMANIYNEDGQKITDFLSEEEYQEIRTFLKERTGMDMDMLKTMRPMVLMSLIYPNLLECETKAFESELMALAKTNDMEIVGLESVNDQLSLFDLIPLKEQYRSFYTYADNIEKGKREFKKLIASYKEEDILALLELVSESPEYKDYQEVLLDQRNLNWIDPMATMMKKGSMFFAVGAGHLAGDTGLIQLLKKKGYSLERLNL